MTLLDLVKHLRISVLDDTGGTGVAWEDITEDDVENYQLRWSNEELTRFINEAEKRVARATLCLKKSEVAFNIAVTAGTADYNYNSKIIRLKDVVLSSTGKNLEPAEIEDLIGIPNWRAKTGTPTSYILDQSDKSIKLYPIPLVDDTVDIVYNRLPLVDLDWYQDVYAEPEIPEEYQLDMLDWALHLAYLKDEANTFDPTRAEYYRQRFISQFSDNNAYAEVRRRNSRGRTVRYGGIK